MGDGSYNIVSTEVSFTSTQRPFLLGVSPMPEFTCPYCGAGISPQDQECQQCRASLEDADLLEEKKRLHRCLQQRRRWAFVFGVPGILLSVGAGSVGLFIAGIENFPQRPVQDTSDLGLFMAGALAHFPLWAVLPLVFGFALAIIGLLIEASSSSRTNVYVATIYGLLGLIARDVFGNVPERLSRVRAILQERGLVPPFGGGIRPPKGGTNADHPTRSRSSA